MNLSSKILPLIIMVFLCSTAQAVKAKNNNLLPSLTYYVWGFSSSSNSLQVILDSLTDDFEEALINSRQGTALERRNYAKLFQQKENEKEIRSLEGVSPISLDNLKALNANVVVFGEVSDDIEGGKIKISVSFQKFNGEILTRNSIYLSRGKRFDPESRRNAMRKLVEEISPSSIETRNDTNKNKARELFYENDFLFVSVTNMSKSKDKKNILLSLSIVNTTNSDIYVSFDVKSSNPTLAGNDGSLLEASSSRIHGLPVIQYNTDGSSNYSKIFAGKKTNVNIEFRSRETIDAVEFNFSSGMIRFNDNQPIRFSVGISNIRL